MQEHARPQISSKGNTQPPAYAHMPEDVLAGLTNMILLADAKGSRCARTCKTLDHLFVEASKSLVCNGIAWWTGSGQPYVPPPLPDIKEPSPMIIIEKATAEMAKYVYGMEVKDVVRISSGWLTNFSIDAILVALGCPVLLCGGRRGSGSYVAHPIEGVPVLSAELSGLCVYPMRDAQSWGRDEDIHHKVRSASIVIVPLIVGGNHWVAVRIVKVHRLVEVFNSLEGPSTPGPSPATKAWPRRTTTGTSGIR